MSFKAPFNKYRPVKTSDGEGGYTEALGTATTVWGLVKVWQNETHFVTDIENDIEIDDQIKLKSDALYRFIDPIIEMAGSQHKSCS